MSQSVLSRLQLGLESLYRVHTSLDVDAYVVGEHERGRALGETDCQRRPREQLLIKESEGELALGLFLDGTAIANLERHDPRHGLCEANFSDFCLAVEGVSHFIYVALRAADDRTVTALELELQAEVDKFASCLLLGDGGPERAGQLRHRLYNQTSLAPDLDPEERDRYRTANHEARRYAGSLDRRFLRHGHVTQMLTELRCFYRLGLDGKLGFIAQAA